MRLAIVILNWNGAAMLHRYLPSVLQCSDEPGVQVIVADNASTDNSRELLAKEFPAVPVIRLDRNYGFAEGYNQALRQVEADAYLLLNSDVEIRQPHWLLPMLDYMDRHPDVAACQPKLLDLRRPGRFEYAGGAGGYIDRLGYPYCRGRVFSSIEADRGQYDTAVSLHWATGAALLVRRAAYWDAGGLDGRFFAHQEEIDLCWRLRARGFRIVCIPQSTAYHLGGASLAQGNPRKTFLNFRNNLLLLYKNLPNSRIDRLLTLRRCLDGLAALKFLLTFDFGNFKAVYRAHREFSRLRPSFAQSRRENLAARNVPTGFRDCAPFSLLWQYYVRRHRRFSQLPSPAAPQA